LKNNQKENDIKTSYYFVSLLKILHKFEQLQPEMLQSGGIYSQSVPFIGKS